MPIEFYCSECQQRLQVPDGSANKQAQCPNCSAILFVPAATASAAQIDTAPLPGPAQPSSPSNAPNPYAAPSATFDPSSSASGQLSWHNFDPGHALTTAWELFKPTAGILIAAYLIQLGFSFAISFASGISIAIAEQVIGNPNAPLVILIQLGTSLLNQLIQGWLTLGFMRISLAIARRQPATVGMLFSGAPYLLRYIGSSILFGIAVTIGLVLLIVPGVYLILTYWSYLYFIVDRDCGVMESFQLAGEYGSGNRMNFFVLALMSMGIMLLGLLACGVGILVAGPLVLLMISVAYLMMTGQFYAPSNG